MKEQEKGHEKWNENSRKMARNWQDMKEKENMTGNELKMAGNDAKMKPKKK